MVGAAPAAGSIRIGLLVHRELEPAQGALRSGLEAMGHAADRIEIVGRFAQGELARLPGLAREIVDAAPACIVAVGAVGANAVRDLTRMIPIVFSIVLDPVRAGFAATMERPGGNVTGITNFDPAQAHAQFELLRECMPRLARVALLSDANAPRAAAGGLNPLEAANEAAARRLGIEPILLRISGSTPDLDATFDELARQDAQVLLALEVPAVILHGRSIAASATARRIPTMFPGGFAASGAMLAFGTTILDTLPLLAPMVERILKGASPGDIPVQVVSRRELVVNLAAARAAGVNLPPAVLARADRVNG